MKVKVFIIFHLLFVVSVFSQEIIQYNYNNYFSFNYYDDWNLNSREDFKSEFIQLFRPDPAINIDKGGQNPNSAKVSFTILNMTEDNLETFIIKRFSDIDDYTLKKTIIDDLETINIYFYMWSEIIACYLKLDDEHVLRIIGYHGSGKDREKLISGIELIQKSFTRGIFPWPLQ